MCQARLPDTTQLRKKYSSKFRPEIPIKNLCCRRDLLPENDLFAPCWSWQNCNGNHYTKKIVPIFLKAYQDPSLFSCKKKWPSCKDGAPAHVTKENMTFLHRQFPRAWGRTWGPEIIRVLDPIAHAWSVLQKSVFRKPCPIDRKSFISKVQQEWKSPTREDLENLTRTFPIRITEIQKVGGGSTKYVCVWSPSLIFFLSMHQYLFNVD